MEPIYGQWEVQRCCVKCDTHLKDYEIYRRDAVCPYCGYKSPVLCKTTDKVRRWVTTHKPHWLLWLLGAPEMGHWEYKKS